MGLTDPNAVQMTSYNNTTFGGEEGMPPTYAESWGSGLTESTTPLISSSSTHASHSSSTGYATGTYVTDAQRASVSGTTTVGRVRRMVQKATVTWASTTFIIIYTFLMLYMIYVNGGIESFDVNPMLGPSVQVLNDFGANNAAEIKYNKQYWRFVTPIFLHAGLIHLAFNVYVQWKIGSDLEAMWGTGTWLAIFLASGAFGNLASSIFMPTVIGVGASGSIMGILGGWLLELICHWSDDTPGPYLDELEAKDQRKGRKWNIFVLVLNVAVTMLLSIVPMVDWAAHVGGVLCGCILGAHFFAYDLVGNCCKGFTLLVSLGLLLVLTMGGLTYFFEDVDPCPDAKDGQYTDFMPPQC